VLGQSLRDTGLAATESTRNGTGSTEDGREHSIKDTLTSDERNISCQFLDDRPGLSDGPLVTHGILSPLSIELQLEHFLVDVVISRRSDVGDFTPASGRHEDAVLREETVLVDATEDIALGKDVSLLDAGGLELPQLSRVQRGHINTLGHEDTLRVLGNHLQRTLDTVEDLIKNTRAQLD
jgi:hypothetical protein